jgi:hypothetical protein
VGPIPSKAYHYVTQNVVNKVIPSLLLSRPPHRSYSSNRFPLLPSLFLTLVGTRSQRFENFDFFKKDVDSISERKIFDRPKVDFNHFGCKEVLTTSFKRKKNKK